MELPEVLDANRRYQERFDLGGRSAPPERHLVILTCMDARLDLLPALGLAVGDAHILRNAGGRASDDAIRSLVVSTHVLGTREVGVIHHTRCGMAASQADIAAATGVDAIDYLSFDDAELSVHDDVERIRGTGWLPEGTVIWGGVYDVDSGALRVVAEPA